MPTAMGNLPADVSSFVGRERELEEIGALLEGARLVTLTGLGGAGKTRLGLRAAAGVDAVDGAWLVELASVTDAALVPSAIAAALGAEPDRLADHVRDARALIVLDNCEHVIDAAAAAATEMLVNGPGVRVLATSREPLGVAGETTYGVPPLGAEAVDLLLARAPAHRRPAPVLAERICRELDGLPLAIELAAARLDVLSPEELAGRLDDRLRVLRSPVRAVAARHSTLRAMIDWSHDLLGAEERRLLARLGVFQGGFVLVAAQEIWGEGDVLDPLERLIRASLVVADTSGDSTRYSMLDTVRRYAAERLAAEQDADSVHYRHAAHYAMRADVVWATWDTAQEVDQQRRLGEDLDDVRAAFDWAAASGEPELVGRLARGFGLVARMLGLLDEVEARAGLALDLLGSEPTALTADLVGIRGLVAVRTGAVADGIDTLERAVSWARLAGDGRSEARHIYSLGYALRTRGDYDRATACFMRGAQVFRSVGDRVGAAWCMGGVAYLHQVRGDLDRAAEVYAAELPEAEATGSLRVRTAFLGDSAELAYLRGRLEEAEALALEAMQAAQDSYDPIVEGVMLELLGAIARRNGDAELARTRLRDALALLRGRELGMVALILEALGGLDRDALLLGAASALRERAGAPRDPNRAGELAADLAAVQDEAGLAAGAAMPLHAAIARAMGELTPASP